MHEQDLAIPHSEGVFATPNDSLHATFLCFGGPDVQMRTAKCAARIFTKYNIVSRNLLSEVVYDHEPLTESKKRSGTSPHRS
jgi:hypothetical protein